MRVVLRDVGYGYPGTSSPVLTGLDLAVASGSVHAVVGPNGCGKSTLLRVIAGLATPTSGAIDFVGERRHQHLTATVFQEPRLLPWWTVERNVAIGHEFGGRSPELYRRIRDFHTRQVGLRPVAEARPGELSMGQQAMAGLARALAHDSEVLLLDEPFVHLDAITRRRLADEFETHWMLEPRTMILVTHDIEEAATLADRVSVMGPGPGPLVDTVEVDVERPRTAIPPDHPGLRSAVARLWEALDDG